MKFFIIAIFLVLFTFGCSDNSTDNPTGSSVVKIAAIIDLTGHYSQFGEEAKNAMDMIKLENSNLQITYYDCQSSSNSADSILNYIISTNEKPAIVTLTSWVSNDLAKKIADNGMLQFPIGAAAFNYADLKSSVKMTEGVDEEGAYLLNLLNTYNRVAVMYFNNDYGISWNSKLQAGLSGKIVATEEYTDTQTDYTSELTNIKEQNPDVIVLISTKEAATIAKQARTLGINAQLTGTRPILTGLLLAEEACDGLIFTYPKIDYSISFFSEFKQKYSYKPGSFTAESYDLVNILLKAQDNNKQKPTEIFNWLANTTYKGGLGAITFDSLCRANYSFTYMKVKNGSFEEIQ